MWLGELEKPPLKKPKSFYTERYILAYR